MRLRLEREEPPAVKRGTGTVLMRAPSGGRRKRAGELGRYASWGGLAVTVAVVLTRLGDGIGGDTVDYVAAGRDPLAPTRFPPGMGLVLSPFSWFGMQAVMLVATVGLVVAMWWAAVKLGGWRSGAIASVLMCLSPSLLAHGNLVMSDRLSALLVVGGLLAVLHDRPLLAGALTGFAGWVRLPAVALCAALPRKAWISAAAVVTVLVVWQLAAQGSIVGYDSDQASWSAAYVMRPVQFEAPGVPPVMSNLVYWPAVLIGSGGWVPPGAGIFGGIAMWRRRREPGTSFAALTVALTLATMLPYYHQSARLVLPAGCMVLIYTAALGGRPPERDRVGRSDEVVGVAA